MRVRPLSRKTFFPAISIFLFAGIKNNRVDKVKASRSCGIEKSNIVWYTKLRKNNKNGSLRCLHYWKEIVFYCYFRVTIKLESNNFYLVSEWLGCPHFEDSPCINKNSSSIKIKIDSCPKCGGKLSIYRLSKIDTKR